jgi:4'-phosphopantetheinyl transferase
VTAGARCGLGERDVHVWVARPDEIQEPGLLAAYRELLSPAELERQGRFLFAPGRHQFLVAHALVRTVLARYAPVDPRSWRFVENEHGRPDLAPGQGPPLCFNLSHADGMIACAVTLARPIGVDVEALERRGDTVGIADRYFSPFEVAALRALPRERQRERFLLYWTLKESYIKARGLGLALPLEQFSFHLDEPGPIRISFAPELADDAQAWQFALFRPGARHVLAVGVRRGRGPDLAIEVRETVPLRD